MSTFTCDTNPTQGIVTLTGFNIPDGHIKITRKTPDTSPYLLRGGSFYLENGGFRLTDSEAPFGKTLTYRLSLDVDDRVSQRNMMLTPTFLHGVKNWLPGTGRTMSTAADPTAHTTAAIGKFGPNSSGAAAAAPPSFIGHVESVPLVNTSYTLTPPTAGAGSIATGDWQYLVHHQLSAVAIPATPAGWTVVMSARTMGDIRFIIWRRKRAGGDTGVTVAAAAGSSSYGTLMWLRGASDTAPVISPVLSTSDLTVTLPGVSVNGPVTTVNVVVAQANINSNPPTADNVTGATWRYTQGNGTHPRTTLIATRSKADAGVTTAMTVDYPEAFQLAIMGVTFAVPAPEPPFADRIIARGKAAQLEVGNQYFMTGRYKFVTSNLWSWNDVLNNGTWSDLTAKTWAQVRSSLTTTEPDAFLRMFVGIWNPADGSWYVEPIQVSVARPEGMGTWVDFSFFFDVTSTIPTTAEVVLMHGTLLYEYAIEWSIDELGITPPDLNGHRPMYWFDGDTPEPANAAELIFGPGWYSVSGDTAITWGGTVGNSISYLRSASDVGATSVCRYDGPTNADSYYCSTPVFLNDPVNPQLGQWYTLLDISQLTYAGRQSLYEVINRGPVTAVSSLRGWASGQLTLLTKTLRARTRALDALAPGRILFLRNPDPNFPESEWYLAIGDVQESRVGSDLRRPERMWTIPFYRVERPSGMIDFVEGDTWQTVRTEHENWLSVRDNNEDWMQVLTGEVIPIV